MIMKISEFIVEVLKQHGVKYVFGLQGSGTAIQMFDALGQADGIDYVCTLHEQAAGMAADAYSALSEGLGACVTTCGPGASNLYTAIAGSYYNSNPVVYIIGQPPTGVLSKVEGLRHFGYHENNLKIFEPVTKYVTQILDPANARYEIEKAISIALSGRPGPVVIALPDDITWLQIEPKNQKGFTDEINKTLLSKEELSSIVKMISKAERPVIIAGKGIRAAHAAGALVMLARELDCPVAPTWGGKDLLPYSYRLNAGSFGVQGTRSGNFTVQNADFVLAIGTRLDPSETGTPQGTFARGARIVSVDIDPLELKKYPKYGINVEKTICADAKLFISELLKLLSFRTESHKKWIDRIGIWKTKYPVFQESYYDEVDVNPYVFIKELSSVTDTDTVIVTDTSTPRNYLFQAYENKAEQRTYTWWNYACLGYGLPAGIGACYANDSRTVAALMGDGGVQFNIQELATIVFNNLNLKIFVFDNGGFANIYHVQNNYMDGRHYGIDREHGLPLPDLLKIAKAYGLPTVTINDNKMIHDTLKSVWEMKGPVFCLIKLPMSHWTVPRKAGKDPIEDMTPKLDRAEFYSEMIVKPLD